MLKEPTTPSTKSELTLSVSVGRKITDSNYGSHDVFECLSGITKDTTEADIDDMLNRQGALAHRKLVQSIKDRLDGQSGPRKS